MIYQVKDNKIVPYLSKSGRKYKSTSRNEKHDHTMRMKRENKYYNFYNSSRWRKLSRKIRSERDPLCKICLRKYHAGKIPLEKVNLSQSVDHIVKLSDDWSKRWDPNNLEGLCNACHREKDKNGFMKCYKR